MEIIRQKYFRANARTMGVIILLFTAHQLYEKNIHGLGILVYVSLNLLAVSFWTAKEIVHIDISEKRIGDGFKLFGLRRINWIKYSQIEKIYINSVKTVGTDIYSLGPNNPVTVRDRVFKSFIKTSDGDKVFLIVEHDKDLLLNKLNKLNQKLGTQIIDQG